MIKIKQSINKFLFKPVKIRWIITILILSWLFIGSFLSSIKVNSADSKLIILDTFLIKDSKDYLSYGFNDLGIYYTPESLIEFNMPIIVKKSISLSSNDLSGRYISKDGKSGTILGNRNPVFDYKIIAENQNYYIINFNMKVKASNNTFSIDFIPSIKGIEYNKYAWWNSSFTKYVVITISKTYIQTPLNNYPILVRPNITICSKADNGKSIRFTGIDNSTLYDYEIERWNSNGYSFIWVKVPRIYSAVDTKFNMYYNNSLAVSSSRAGYVWDSNFLAVWHMNNLSGTVRDVTNNTHDAVNTVNPQSYGVTTNTGYGVDFEWSNGIKQYFTVGNSTDLDGLSALSIEAYVSVESTTNPSTIIAKGGVAYNTECFIFTHYTSGNFLYRMAHSVPSNQEETYYGDGSFSTGWYYDVGTWATGEKLKFYKNMVYLGTSTNTFAGMQDNDAQACYIGNQSGVAGNPNRNFDGIIDEIRLSNIVRNNSWKNATYYCLTNQSGFVTFSSVFVFVPPNVLPNATSFYPVNNSVNVHISQGFRCYLFDKEGDKIYYTLNCPKNNYYTVNSCFNKTVYLNFTNFNLLGCNYKVYINITNNNYTYHRYYINFRTEETFTVNFSNINTSLLILFGNVSNLNSAVNGLLANLSIVYGNITTLYSNLSNVYTKTESDNTFLSALFQMESAQLFLLILLALWLFFVAKYLEHKDKIIAYAIFGLSIPLSIIIATISLNYAFGYFIVFIIPILSLVLLADSYFYSKQKKK